MNTKLIHIAACLLLAAITNLPIAKADPRGEADFLALRGKVRERAAGEPFEVKQRIKNAELTLTACLPGTPEPQDSRVSIALDDVDYFYGAPCASTDCTYQCLYMVEPLHRALTLEEARDFSAALMMPDIPHAGYGKTGRARKAAIAAQGEKKMPNCGRSCGQASRHTSTRHRWAPRSGPPHRISWTVPPYRMPSCPTACCHKQVATAPCTTTRTTLSISMPLASNAASTWNHLSSVA